MVNDGPAKVDSLQNCDEFEWSMDTQLILGVCKTQDKRARIGELRAIWKYLA